MVKLLPNQFKSLRKVHKLSTKIRRPMLDTQHAWCLHSHAHDSRAALHNGCARMDGQGYTRASQIRQTISTCARDSDGLRAFLNMLSAPGSVWKFLYRSKSVMKALEGSICILAVLQRWFKCSNVGASLYKYPNGSH